MARIRTIKPDFWSNEKVLGIKPLTRLLFIGMWNFADDYGRMDFAPLGIRAKVFPNDELAANDVRDMLNELCSGDLIIVYSANNKEYIEITGWDHQRIDKRQASKIPAPFAESSVIRGIPPTSPDLPPNPPTPAPVMEGNGRDGNVVDSEANASGADAPPDPAVPEREYFLRGREVLGSKSGAMIANLLKAKGKNVALARAALEEASQKQNPMEFVAAICRGPPPVRASTVYQQRQVESREILSEIDQSIARRSGAADFIAIRDDTGNGREAVRGGIGLDVIDVPAKRDRSSG